ncbi:MAG: hypothetical protein IPN20_04720 [Haliscomenobacter sp.]|nr:hypothetical protein [Haliscomenobacter sp.]
MRLNIEAVQRPGEGELGQPHGHVQSALFTAGHFGLAEKRQGLAQVQVTTSRFIQQGVELIAQGGQLQPGEQAGENVGIDVHQPPPNSASYSVNGRNKVGMQGGVSAVAA